MLAFVGTVGKRGILTETGQNEDRRGQKQGQCQVIRDEWRGRSGNREEQMVGRSNMHTLRGEGKKEGF